MYDLDFDFVDVLDCHTRPFRAKFNPSVVWNKLDRYKNNLVGFRNFFKQFKTKVTFETHKNLKNRGKVAVGGAYYLDDNRCELLIIIKSFDQHIWTGETWDSFKYKVIQVSMHELVHMRQYINRDFEDDPKRPMRHSVTGNKKIDENLSYYSEHDEVEAYGHCVYLDYLRESPSKSLTVFLNKNQSKTLSGIRRAFKHDTEQITVPAVIKLAHTWQRRYNRHNIVPIIKGN